MVSRPPEGASPPPADWGIGTLTPLNCASEQPERARDVMIIRKSLRMWPTWSDAFLILVFKDFIVFSAKYSSVEDDCFICASVLQFRPSPSASPRAGPRPLFPSRGRHVTCERHVPSSWLTCAPHLSFGLLADAPLRFRDPHEATSHLPACLCGAGPSPGLPLVPRAALCSAGQPGQPGQRRRAGGSRHLTARKPASRKRIAMGCRVLKLLYS